MNQQSFDYLYYKLGEDHYLETVMTKVQLENIFEYEKHWAS